MLKESGKFPAKSLASLGASGPAPSEGTRLAPVLTRPASASRQAREGRVADAPPLTGSAWRRGRKRRRGVRGPGQ